MDHPNITALARILRIQDSAPMCSQESYRIKKRSTALSDNGHTVYHCEDHFDSRFFAKCVGKILGIEVDGHYDRTTFQHLVHSLPYEYVLFRDSQQHKAYLQDLLKMDGSLFLDTMVELVAPRKAWRPKQADLQTDDEDLLALVPALAQQFRFGRLFCDPTFEKGSELYEEWLINSIQKKVADRVVALRTQTVWDGFASIKDVSLGTLRGWDIPLLVKHPDSSRPNFAEAILRAIQASALQQNIDYLTIATHGENIQALRGYIAAGFSPYDTTVSIRLLHKASKKHSAKRRF